LTEAELKKLLAKNPQVSCEDPSGNLGLSPAKSKPHPRDALGNLTEGSDKSLERITIRFVSCCIRFRDADNLAGGCKNLLDGLSKAGLIPDDSPEYVSVTYEQEKVRTKLDERIEIFITRPV
jgi:hypothetical protein